MSDTWRERNKKRLGGLVFALLTVGGCVASDPDAMQPVYVSPDDYRDLDCAAIAREMKFVGARTLELYDRLDNRRRADFWQAGAAYITLGISALYLDGDGPEADEYRRLKGEFDALRIVGCRKDCGLEAASPEEIVRRAEAATASAKGEE
jgi:hypothetical protein